ncbi:unnamed protein product [Durusdinium trenchii]
MIEALILGSSLCLLAAAQQECDATLEVSTLKGPDSCTPDGIKKLTKPQEKAFAECTLECAKAYTVKFAEGKPSNMAVAISKSKECSNKDLGMTFQCSEIPLTCAKPFDEFPNSCSGIVPIYSGIDYFVAFYAYCAEKGPNSYQKILDTNLLLSDANVCQGEYSYTTQSGGNCLGLQGGQTSCDKMDGPPEPPEVPGMPQPFPLAGFGGDQCEANLKKETMAGPGGCTPEGVAKITDPQEKLVIECFHECASSYTLQWKAGSTWKVAVAVPKTKTCSKMSQLVCAPVALTCTKTFGEFPNACAGVVTMGAPFYVAFYSYGELVDGKVTTVLDTAVVADANTVCSGKYSVDSGHCMGIASGEAASEVVKPPAPPHVDGLPIDHWPMPDPTPAESTAKPTEKPTAKPDGTTEQPDGPAKKPEETSGGHPLLWIMLGLIVVAIVLAAFYVRRNRLLEDERRLRDAQEVEIQG